MFLTLFYTLLYIYIIFNIIGFRNRLVWLMLSSAFPSLSNSLRSNLRKEKSKSWTSWNQFDVISRLPWFSYNSSHLDCLTSQMVSADTQGNALRHRFGKDFYRRKGPAATSGISPDDFSQMAGRMWEIIGARRTCGERKKVLKSSTCEAE